MSDVATRPSLLDQDQAERLYDRLNEMTGQLTYLHSIFHEKLSPMQRHRTAHMIRASCQVLADTVEQVYHD